MEVCDGRVTKEKFNWCWLYGMLEAKLKDVVDMFIQVLGEECMEGFAVAALNVCYERSRLKSPW